MATKPAAHELNGARKYRNDNYAENEKGQIVFHHGHIAEKKSAEYKETDPENAAERAVSYEARVDHAPDTGNKWRESPDYGKEAREDDGFAAMLCIELMCFLQMSPVQ